MEAMIEFNSQNDFVLANEATYRNWLSIVAKKEDHEIQDLGYVFCSDNFLLDINQRYLEHDTLTDIITFDYCVDKNLSGEIYISTQRVAENAISFGVDTNTELRRVMVHGLLHLCGYGDKEDIEKELMREKESYYMGLFTK
ncbi:MAG TPA: rRNA maturation RNase YbeY [Leeuwenhoekiella sp.]|nr:rRNA maturation RNase YbeY [Leeuwenhoekiella sp.]